MQYFTLTHRNECQSYKNKRLLKPNLSLCDDKARCKLICVYFFMTCTSLASDTAKNENLIFFFLNLIGWFNLTWSNQHLCNRKCFYLTSWAFECMSLCVCVFVCTWVCAFFSADVSTFRPVSSLPPTHQLSSRRKGARWRWRSLTCICSHCGFHVCFSASGDPK